MSHPYFFGYGSLVNAQTHVYAPVHPARAKGWRRGWRATDPRDAAFLTAIPDTTSEIEGLIAPVPGGDWAALDEREAAYARHDASHQIQHNSGAAHIAIYAIESGKMRPATAENPILLSYLDVVVRGYLQVFGADGVVRFFETTDGWHAPILNDRASPRYPRAQILTEAETACVDDHLARLGCTILR